MTIEELLNDYDWGQAFCFASDGKSESPCYNSGTPFAVPEGADVPLTPFARSDVEQIIASSEGENEGKDWLIVVKLKDGRYGFVGAGCDYTGWD